MTFITHIIGIVAILCSLSGFSQSPVEVHSKTIMLILGSGNLNTSIARAEVGFNVYNSEKNFDYIIVSGGCGAHSSSICEATVMADVLIEKGVPEHLIFKEEKSKSTAQNYCYSRELKNRDGTPLINKGDRLFVVSNHWHAMSVSGCFSDKDLVNSKYIIEGNISPKQTDKTDYGSIYENCVNNPNYCKSVLWPKIDAAYYIEAAKKKSQNYATLFIDDLSINSQDSTEIYISNLKAFKELPEFWKSDIDASFYNTFEDLIYTFKGDEVVAIQPSSSKIEPDFPKTWHNFFGNLPEYWQEGPLDAAFFNSKTKQIYIFKGDHYMAVPYKKHSKLFAGESKPIAELVVAWPFNWGTGDIDAALFQESTGEVIFYRGQEQLKLKFDGEHLFILENTPKKIALAWPTALWGNRS